MGVGASRSATFTVVAAGEGLTYQWFGPGGMILFDVLGEIAGATTATLQIFNVQSDDVGRYQVQVSNVGGSVNSEFSNVAISKGKLYLLFISLYNHLYALFHFRYSAKCSSTYPTQVTLSSTLYRLISSSPNYPLVCMHARDYTSVFILFGN